MKIIDPDIHEMIHSTIKHNVLREGKLLFKFEDVFEGLRCFAGI